MYNGRKLTGVYAARKMALPPTPHVTTGSFWGNNDVTEYSDQSEQFFKSYSVGLL